MKTVPISELRQRIADVIEDAREANEPTVILQRSRPAAYIVSPERYERDQKELSTLRRQLFLAEVREAEAEYRAGDVRGYEGMEQLLDDLRS
jgi:prevent-host-death family protein